MNKRKLIISSLAALAAFAFMGSVVLAGTVLKQDGVSASATKSISPGAILDDFRYDSPSNLWGDLTGVFSKSSTTPTPADENCTASNVYDAGAENGRAAGNCLKLDYNINAANTYAGYYSKLGSASLGSPLPGTIKTPSAISFYVKGAAGGEFFKIQLKNTSTTLYTYGTTTYYRNTAAVYITDYLDGGVTTSWQKVTIPFSNFPNINFWNTMAEFDIVFENAQSVINGSMKQGTVYIDDIVFETTAITTFRVDHFGDYLGTCALGGGIGMGVGATSRQDLNTFNFSNTANEYSPYPNGMRINYDVTNYSTDPYNRPYAYVFFIFGGGQDTNPNPAENKSGWIPIPKSAGRSTMLTFNIRARSVGENPENVKVELDDGVAVEHAFYAIDIRSDVWQRYEMPLSLFTNNMDKTRLRKLTFTFENAYVADKSGVVFIDSVQFE